MADEAVPQQQPTPQAPPQEPMVNVVDPDTQELGSIPASQLQDAMSQGFTMATPEHVEKHFKEQEFGTAGQQVAAGVEGVAKGLLGPIATGAERLAGISPTGIAAREEVNPLTHGIGEAAGLIAPAVLTGGESLAARATMGGAMEAVGSAGVKALGLEAAENAPALMKIGSAAAKGAIENMVFQGGDEVSRMILQDPNQSAQTAVTDIGLAALIGGGVSGAFGAVNPLWKAVTGSKVGGLLKAVSDKAGGIEGHIPDAMEDAIIKSGMDLAPEVKAGLSNDPEIQNAFKTLEQSDTTTSGQQLQEKVKKFRKDAGETMVKALGKDPATIEHMELSPYESGKAIGESLSSEIQEKMEPLAKEFEDLKTKYGDAELRLDVKVEGGTNFQDPYHQGELPPQTIPGTATDIANKVTKLAEEQGWTTSPSSDIMKAVNNMLKELPGIKTLKDLGKFMTQVGNNTASTLPFGAQTPLSRAGSMIKSILRDAEAEVAMTKLGSEGPELVERFKAARDAYKIQAQIKEALDERLKVGGSVSGFAKGVKNMAQTDGESLLRRLSGKGDADLLNLLETRFPKTAQLIKDYHINDLLKNAVSKAKPGQTLNSNALLKSIEKMSPELRKFAISDAALSRVNAIGKMLEQFDSMPHNFSNTARTMDKLFKDVPSSVVAMATMLMGHNPVMAVVLGKLTGYMAKDVPDAARLALLKFMGSDKPINAAGFKAMVDMIHSTTKGENAITKATKNVFKAEAAIIPEHMRPSDSDRTKLDKALQKAQTNPENLINSSQDASHYLPEYGAAIGQITANASNYINSKRPNANKTAPLDSDIKPSNAQKSEFNRTLDLAQQPLVILDSIKSGNVTPQDVITVKMLYPDLYNRLAQKLTSNISAQVDKGETVPYKTRLGLSMFLGTPLDSTMSPQGILGAQPVPRQAPQGGQQGSNVKKGTSTLTKMPKSYQTSDQAAEARGMKD